MMETDLTGQLEGLFHEVGEAHHRAYIETDGADPEWPLWYADYLRERLEELLEPPASPRVARPHARLGCQRAAAQGPWRQLGQVLRQVLYHSIHINLLTAR